ncbi:MAG: hypothetical protein GY873_22425 [Bosea sp.]|jgi:hypothetical protein|uniref:hypothetical protein n=1 Tax=Hyphomicrobiales TaxID=356 RepID=UPI0008364BC0|nr:MULTISPECIES: hypothetical protein [Hyphomicrobiales]MCP4561757.1 hypothetical protein [Bosea sp. (in: a-proteobacteria)]MCP4736948.1 hypothetical protein [Bosea sp. (in: a-proteobacteria)]MDX3805063.1 hypothetical protein [Bosea sp. (in: a-proteobacteria)]
MSASLIFDIAPLGSLVSYSDGSPKPPTRFTKKLAAWERRNGVGRLVRKVPERERPTYTAPPCFTLNEGSFGQDGLTVMTVIRTYGIDSDLTFRVVERPRIGQIRIVQTLGESDELLHLAEDREAAELWLAKNGYRNARLEPVCPNEVGADVVEGRAT